MQFFPAFCHVSLLGQYILRNVFSKILSPRFLTWDIKFYATEQELKLQFCVF
jgi:hypothetical protein